MNKRESTDPPLILVVDDNEFALEGMSQLLEFAGYKVVTAPDGRAALRAIEEHDPDLVVCDFGMPDMNGLEVLELLRAARQTRSLPFILATAFGDPALRMMCLEYPKAEYVEKQNATDALLHAVGKYLSHGGEVSSGS